MNIRLNIQRFHQIAILILIIGLGLRLFNFGNYPFRFDQVQIMEASDRILSGDLTLIGPRTGPAEMFTGPLIYYLNAISLFFINSIQALVLTTNVIYLITGLSLILVAPRYISHRQTLIFIGIWTLSPWFVSLDRIPWNPNLSFLAGSLTLLPLLGRTQLKQIDLVLIFVGTFLGYQAHFSGFILPVLVWVGLLVRKEKSIKNWLTPILGLTASLLPTILFDLRHNWLNSKGLIQLLSQQSSGLSDKYVAIFNSLTQLVEIFGLIWLQNFERSLVIGLGLILVLLLLIISRRNKQPDQARKIVVFWLLIFTFVLGLYSGNVPPYYYLIVTPAVLYLQSGIILEAISRHKFVAPVLVITLFIWFGYQNYRQNYFDQPNSLATTLAADKLVTELSRDYPVGQIEYQMEHVFSEGLRYQLSKLSLSDDGWKYIFVFPYQSDEAEAYRYGVGSALKVEPGK